jgi:hypothetical protein
VWLIRQQWTFDGWELRLETVRRIQIGDGKYLKVIEAEPFDAFAVHPSSVSVYHLGNNCTARAELKSWQL